MQVTQAIKALQEIAYTKHVREGSTFDDHVKQCPRCMARKALNWADEWTTAFPVQA